MAKRKLSKNETIESVNKIENVDVIVNTNVIEESTVIDVDDKVDDEIVADEIVEEKPKVTESATNTDTKKIIKKPLLFGYVWNGQEYD